MHYESQRCLQISLGFDCNTNQIEAFKCLHVKADLEFQRLANQVQLNFLSKCVRCNSQENILFHFGGEETQFLGLSASFIHQSHIWQW